MSSMDASGNPGTPVNLGPVINTKYDEQAPYYHIPSGTLVFSSNGRVGMGGYDFYFSKGTKDNFSEPQNFGHPVNSVKDDIYFTSRGPANNILDNVLFSSDRSAACCLELFAMNKVRPLKQIQGLVVSCDNGTPLPNVTVQVLDTVRGQTVSTLTTNAEGRYTFTLADYMTLKLTATGEGYMPGTIVMNLPSDVEQLTLTNPALCLAPPVDAKIVLENVFYDFNKSNLREESFPALDHLVNMMTQYPTMVIEVSAHTDNLGSHAYNQRLSEARAQSVVRYLVSKGIEQSRLQSKGYAATQPIAPNQNPDGSDNPEGRQKNRRTEFKVLNY
jgi:outer membrane protein OmpA-like peptidoglycan-associated protein